MKTSLSLVLLLSSACGSDQSREAPPPHDPPAPATEVARQPSPVSRAPTSEVLDTSGWSRLLAAYVTEDGGFRYAALQGTASDRETLDQFVEAVGAASPDAWTRDEKLAFYINAYNALTVSAVIERWPLASVMDVPGFFDGIEHQVAGSARTLNGLEGDVIRSEEFAEPRIHFAVNCASTSCPPLSGEAFTAQNLESQLQALTDAFVRGTTRVDARRRRVNASKLFEWYAADFGGEPGVRTFLASHLDEEASQTVSAPRTQIRYDDYDWATNARE